MANEFSNKWLTPDGQAYLAAAATGNRIIFVRALANTAYLDDNAAIVASSYSISDGTVTASQSAGTARIIAEFPNRTSAGVVVKTVAIVAKMESVYTTEKVILVQRDSNYGAYIPSVNDAISQRTQIFFTLGLTQNNSIVVTDGGYAAKGDFDNLADRVVTAHALNDPDSGDNQDVYGLKSFQTGCDFYGSVYAGCEITAEGGISVGDHFDCGCDLKVHSDVVCISTGTHNIGESANPFDNVYSTNATFDGVTHAAELYSSNADFIYLHVGEDDPSSSALTVSGPASFYYQTTFNGNVNMPDSGDNTLDVYCASSFSGDVTVSSPAQFEVEGNSYLNGTTTVNAVRRANSNSTIGTELAPFKNIYCTSADFTSLGACEIEMSGNILRSTASGTYNIGSATYKFSNVYATTFHGSLDGNAISANTAGSAGSATSADTASFATRATHANRLSYTSGTVNTAYLTTGPSNVIAASASITPSATSNTYTLGNSSYRWSTVYTKNIDCSYNANIGILGFDSLSDASWTAIANKMCSVGRCAIALVRVQISTSSSTSDIAYARGTDLSVITNAGGTIWKQDAVAGSPGGTLSLSNQSEQWTLSGTWKLLSFITKNTNTYHLALIIRVS